MESGVSDCVFFFLALCLFSRGALDELHSEVRACMRLPSELALMSDEIIFFSIEDLQNVVQVFRDSPT